MAREPQPQRWRAVYGVSQATPVPTRVVHGRGGRLCRAVAVTGRAVLAAVALALPAAATGCGDGDDVVEEGRQATVGGIEYTVTLSRPLNPRDEPDSAYYRGSPPGQGRTLVGVFLTACNAVESMRWTTDDLLLVDSPFETRFKPVPTARDNPFAYRPTRLRPDECLPRPGSAAAQTAEAVVVIFELRVDTLENRPLQLVVDERAGPVRIEGAKRIRLDL